VPTNSIRAANGGHAEPVIGRAFARPGGFAHPTIPRHCEPTGRREAPPDDRLREAIQGRKQELDCFVARAPRNDVDDDAPPTPTTVIPAKAGIQYAASSRFRHGLLGILDRPPSRTMTNAGILATASARGLQIFRPEKRRRRRPSKEEGAGKIGCTLHPRSHVQNAQSKKHTSIQVQRKQFGLPCAVLFRLISAQWACLPAIARCVRVSVAYPDLGKRSTGKRID
jgi:hypothetical protein